MKRGTNMFIVTLALRIRLKNKTDRSHVVMEIRVLQEILALNQMAKNIKMNIHFVWFLIFLFFVLNRNLFILIGG